MVSAPLLVVQQQRAHSAPRLRQVRQQTQGIRAINGELLPPPCEADLRGNQIDADKIPASSRLAKTASKSRVLAQVYTSHKKAVGINLPW
jgi:hypothetical protein